MGILHNIVITVNETIIYATLYRLSDYSFANVVVVDEFSSYCFIHFHTFVKTIHLYKHNLPLCRYLHNPKYTVPNFI
jgi:hypothetical protein